jgi:serine/threonine protein kinase
MSNLAATASAVDSDHDVAEAVPGAGSPVAAVDVLLEASLAVHADHVWIEPVPMAEDHYLISVEQNGAVIATSTIDSGLATGMMARLAFLSDVDLTSPRAVSGCVRIRARESECDLVYTLRPGTSLRGELMLVRTGPRLMVTRDRYEELSVGERVDHYRVLSRLGMGGMGSVYKVEHVTLGRVHALKVLQGAVLQRDVDSAERFLREARAASRIRHPNIVDVFDFGYLPDGRPYFVMELLPGHSLADLIDHGALAPARAVAITRQLCAALAAAHQHGVIHADVSPSNALVLEEGEHLTVKLVDFGLAELKEPTVTRVESTQDYVLGTPCYIAPEQIRGLGADEQSDQYSLGIVLYEALTGRPPFHDKNIRELCLRHLRDPVPEPKSPYGPLPTELTDIIHRCLQKSPTQRYPNMRALLVDLEEVEKLVDRRGWRRWLAK